MAYQDQIATIESSLASWYEGGLTPGEVEALRRNILRYASLLPLAIQRDARLFLSVADTAAADGGEIPTAAPARLSETLYRKYRPTSPRIRKLILASSAAAAVIILVIAAASISVPHTAPDIPASPSIASMQKAAEYTDNISGYPDDIADPAEALDVAAGALRLIHDNIQATDASLRDVNIEFAATSKSIQKSFR